MTYLYKYPCPPQNHIAEEILIGIILIYPSMLVNILPFIKEEYFFLECHQIIYIHILNIYKKNKVYPLELLYDLSDSNILYQIGGVHKIIDMMKQSQIFVSSNKLNIYTKELIEIIHLNYIKRLMIQYGQNIIQLAYVKNISNYKLYNKASYYLDFTEKKIPQYNIQSFQDLITNLLLNIQYPQEYKVQEKQKIVNHLKSGFQEIDKFILGLSNGDLIVIAGRPSMGKTSLAINFACNILQNINTGLCFFSLEMSNEQILNKFIAISSNIPIKDIILNQLNYNQWKNIKKICEKLLHNYIYINQNTDLSIDYIEYTSKLLKKENNTIKLIIIDYLQLIQTDNSYNINRVQELSYITRRLKLLAQYLNIPIIILSQLNRSIETRKTKNPILSDLKESGCIDFKHNILLNFYNINGLNIKNIIIYNFNEIQLAFYKKQLNLNYFFLQSNHVNSSFFMEYVFKIHSINVMNLTYNHRLLKINTWIKIESIIDNEIIIYKNNLNKIKKICTKYYINIVNHIIYKKYSIVYDLSIISTFHFILYEKIILHNSIEQDADIVMMLHKQNQEDTNLNKKATIDIAICKNRNGPTGSCKLYFSKDSTKFDNMHNFNNQQIYF
uniref:DNA 5'-3' helicase n=1 Tax=Sphondylothamnion multifidum TaxID=193186 RepID=A0A4D6WYY9_9FLOR|nr:replication helicase subunit [Sphondylothamnion multifidum]